MLQGRNAKITIRELVRFAKWGEFRFDKAPLCAYTTGINRKSLSIQAPVAPDGAGGNDEAGVSPALSRNCNPA